MERNAATTLNAQGAAVYPAGTPLLQVAGLDVVAGARLLVRALSFELRAGDFLAVLGCNGSGKTLTMHTLAGLRAAEVGEISYRGNALRGMPRRAVAREVALLPQVDSEGQTTTVLEHVLLGRHAHLATWRWSGAVDEAIACAALGSVGLQGFAHRSLDTLSGGEQRRANCALTLAQQSSVLLLDEPSNHLDPQHALAVLGVFKSRSQQGAAVIATLHDPTLAARYATHILLLLGDGRWRLGDAVQMLDPALLSELYGTAMGSAVLDGRTIFAAL